MNIKISNRIKGIANISFAHMITLGVALGTSFLMPIFLSVESYGYWQLFSLYGSYVGFFALGLNDGVHLNYSSYDLNQETAPKFKTFTSLMIVMNLIETIIVIAMVIIGIDHSSEMFWICILIALNILPANIGILYTYINQATMRFKEYSRGLLIDRVIFFVAMSIMLVCGVKNYLMYILAFTISRYSLLIYHFYTSRIIIGSKGQKIRDISPEVKHCFQSGFVLMIAVLLNGSITVCSSLLVEAKFGIEEFSGYNFSIHTLTIARQVITSLAAVFYPIMKRCNEKDLHIAYDAFNKATNVLAIVLLFSYYLASFAILLLYKQYTPILEYYSFIYPLFLFECKCSMLVVNMYKVMEKPWRLIINNGVGIALNFVAAFIASIVFENITAVAIAVLVSYCLWYYIGQLVICKQMKWKFSMTSFADLLLVCAFILITQLSKNVTENIYLQVTVGAIVYIVVSAIFVLIRKKNIKGIINDTMIFLKD